MKIEIEVDKDEAERRIGVRERVGLYLLMAMFSIVFPTKYKHRMDGLWDVLKLLADK